MADVIRKATNRFTKGLVMDFSPENTKNELLTHALNATLLTFNGNELSLQNDMGNARVETAYLPEGYMPVGTCEYGGIIYIVSYNPLENKSQIGCFPSPERNISSDELGTSNQSISRDFFQNFKNGAPDGTLNHTTQFVILKNDNLNPGDKFLVCSNKDIYNEKLADLFVDVDRNDSTSDFQPISNPIIALNVVSIEDSGKIVYLNSDLKQYDVPNKWTTIDKDGNTVEHDASFRYHILGKMMEGTNQVAKEDIDSYRNALSSGYSVFKSKTSGKLAILAELIMIDSYSVTHEVRPKKVKKVENGQVIEDVVEGAFDVIVHTDITPVVTTDNYLTVPKLKYYYLSNSQGYIQVNEGTETLFKTNQDGKVTTTWNSNFFDTPLSEIYEPTVSNIDLNKKLSKTGQFNFPKPYTYHGRMGSYSGNLDGVVDNSVYTKFTEGKFHRIKKSQIWDNYQKYYINELRAKFYKYTAEENEYQKVESSEDISESYVYYVKETLDVYTDVKRNTFYKDNPAYILYKMYSEPQMATDIEIQDKQIEKYQYIKIHTYLVSSNPELDYQNGEILYEYVAAENKYVQLSGTPIVNVTYYTLKTEEVLVSVGSDVNQDEIQGVLYYFPSRLSYIEASKEDLDKYWDFKAYPEENNETLGAPIVLYWWEGKPSYKEATESEIVNSSDLGIELYYKTDYTLVDNMQGFSDEDFQLFIVTPMDTYVHASKFVPNASYNYIYGYDKPKGVNEPQDGYPKDDFITLHTVSDFIPENLDTDDNMILPYNELKLANIKIPGTVSVNGLDLPFKYDYTLVPCMNYGRLDHLAISSTVDFSKLHAFNQSNFSTWKYHIDDNQLRLTFGAEVYDTYEINKIDGLVLEFYDLWGFAGSLEITDKKSYSGIFTKVISLNSLGALSKRKIEGSWYSENYVHNVNIVEEKDKSGNVTFKFNGNPVEYINRTKGWSIKGELNNDCGTLYSNMLYGVKAYLRRDILGVKEFIPKSEFFLYTFPILNDFYYTVNDFRQISYPQLELALTYKLVDSGSKIIYSSDDIVNGYCPSNKEMVNNYLSGFLEGIREFDLIRYYKYQGTSKLFLEVGLKKEYEALNLRHSDILNNIFYCTLDLVSDDPNGKSYFIQANDNPGSSNEAILNYNNQDNIALDLSLNKLEFGNNNRNSIGVNLTDTTFIKKQGNSPILINYEFVVGYDVAVSNISSTEVPSTTVCALCHQIEEGIYNLEDFGIYLKEDSGLYLSSAMIYNGGTKDTEISGICRMIDPNASSMGAQCSDITRVENVAVDIREAGRFNTNAMKTLSQYIGKLTFCQPHAHAIEDANGVNIYQCSGTILGVAPDPGEWSISGRGEHTRGHAPALHLYENPKYNLTLNTLDSVKYHGEFISTIDYNTVTGSVKGWNSNKGEGWKEDCTMREFSGLTGPEVADFNKKLITTMKDVYAYNPDYDSLKVNVGNVKVEDKDIKFTSNIVSKNASLVFKTGETFNDYIYLGSFQFSKYLIYLNEYSKNADDVGIVVSNDERPLPQIELTPGFDYCGSQSTKCLISSLTYRTPSPTELEDELTFKASDNIVVKHHDNNMSFIKGEINKKTLYGFDHDLQKLIQLDVSNYTIDRDGTLLLESKIKYGSNTAFRGFTEQLIKDAHNYTYQFQHQMSGLEEEGTANINVNMMFYAALVSISDKSVILAMPLAAGEPINIGFSCWLTSYSTRDYSFPVTLNGMTYSAKGRLLNPEKVTYGYTNGSNTIDLLKQPHQTLAALVGSYDQNVSFIDASGRSYNDYVGKYWLNPESMSDGFYEIDNTVNHPIFQFPSKESNSIALVELNLIHFNYTVEMLSSAVNYQGSVVKVNKTTDYCNIDAKTGKYIIPKYPKACLKGTSITLNDLMYEPVKDGHRLFIRKTKLANNGNPRNVIFYRSMSNNEEWRDLAEYTYKNRLYLYTGPCFTSSNLNT